MKKFLLLTWDPELGMPRRLKEDEEVKTILYGLDALEISTKLYKRTDDQKPPDVFTCPKTGLPLRPLYMCLERGQPMRAVPISWSHGVDYYEWRALHGDEEKKR